jgi:hypothetical protein
VRRPQDWIKALSLKPQADDQIVARRSRTEIVLIRHHEASRKRRSRGYLITWWHRKDFHYGKLHDPTVTTIDIDYHVLSLDRTEWSRCSPRCSDAIRCDMAEMESAWLKTPE